MQPKRMTAWLFMVILTACGPFPRDPGNSFQEALTTGLRVGVIDDPPWARMEGETAAGYEADMIKSFAAAHHMRIDWVSGAEHNLMQALAETELHLVIGGITKDSPFRELVGFTNPHSKEDILICGLGGSSDIKDRKIGVAKGSGVGAFIRKRNGVPVYMDSLSDFSGPVAVSRRGHEAPGFKDCSDPIKTLHHVVAVAKGENLLLLKLEEHINESGRR